MHTYIYPVLSCCKLCTPIPAPAFAGRLFKLCTPIYTQTPPALCRHLSRSERLCPELVPSIGAHFFCLFLFAFFRRLVCCYMYTFYERRYLLRCTLFISRRRLRGTICIHILSGYLQQRFRLRYTFFSILFSLLFFLLCYTFQYTRHTAPKSPAEPRFCPFLPFFLLFWYLYTCVFHWPYGRFRASGSVCLFYFFFLWFFLDFVAFFVDFVCTLWT